MKKTSHKTSDCNHKSDDSSQNKHTEESCTPSSKKSTSAAPEPIDLQAEVTKYRDQAMRTAADLENYRKRMAREKEDAIRYANYSLFEKLLPILDNFELGLEAAKATSHESALSILNGLSMVQRQLNDFIKAQGMEPIDAEGTVFDPKIHDAIGHEPHDTLPEGHVIRQMRRGYRLADRLVRPASVVVSKGKLC